MVLSLMPMSLDPITRADFQPYAVLGWARFTRFLLRDQAATAGLPSRLYADKTDQARWRKGRNTTNTGGENGDSEIDSNPA